MAGEEPRSLRRLRESLANLEHLERHRKDLRNKWDDRGYDDYAAAQCQCGNTYMPDSDYCRKCGAKRREVSIGPAGAQGFSHESSALCGGLSRSLVEGQRSLSPSKRASGSPRRSSHHLGHANRGGGSSSSSATPIGIRPSKPRSPSPFMSNRVQRAADEFSTRFQRAADDYSSLAGQRDSALAVALEKSQDRIELLKRERDEVSMIQQQACSKLANQESEITKIAAMLERSEAEHRCLSDERQREAADRSAARQSETAELQRARRETREAQEQLTALQKEASQARCTAEEWKTRFERLLADQRQQIETLGDASSSASRDLAEQTRRAAAFGEALYTCLHERNALLHFVVDVLTALQSLFYDPTPFCSMGIQAANSRAGCNHNGAPSRPRSASVDRWHRHSGCYACTSSPGGHRTASPSAFGNRHTHGRQEVLQGAQDLRELANALEEEIGGASSDYSALVNRVVGEAEKNARVLGLLRGPGMSIADCAASSDEAGSAATGSRSVLRTCLDWIAQEKRGREALGIPKDSLAPSVDWSEERSQYQAVTRSMHTKFEQLSKLKKVLHARHNGARRVGPVRGHC